MISQRRCNGRMLEKSRPTEYRFVHHAIKDVFAIDRLTLISKDSLGACGFFFRCVFRSDSFYSACIGIGTDLPLPSSIVILKQVARATCVFSTCWVCFDRLDWNVCCDYILRHSMTLLDIKTVHFFFLSWSNYEIVTNQNKNQSN